MVRSTINKVLILAGGLMSLTGIFLFFHYESFFAVAIHELAALCFIVFGFFHIKVNWASIIKSFKSSSSIYVYALIFLSSVAIMLFTGSPKF